MARPAFRPKQTLGQNFLVDENVSRKIADAINPQPDDFIIEIGPGFGALTKYLVDASNKILAIEIDGHLAGQLERKFAKYANFEVIHGDFLKQDLWSLAEGQPVRIVGNIPYHITSPVIFKVFDDCANASDLTLMIQREVAERIVASPRTKAYGILSVVSQLHSMPKSLFHVSRNVFKPRPDVESTVVSWDISAAPQLDVRNPALLRQLIRATFNQRRKMLRKSLQQLPEFGTAREHLNFELERRPEELTVAEFVELSNQLDRNRQG